MLRLIALGYTNGEIATRLYLSVRTVESHRAHIQQKTGRTTRAALVAYAREHELASERLSAERPLARAAGAGDLVAHGARVRGLRNLRAPAARCRSRALRTAAAEATIAPE